MCTGNIARSPALAILLAAARPDLTIQSAGVGRQVRAGRCMARQMRLLMAEAGHADDAAAHRSRPLAAVVDPGTVICCAPVHDKACRDHYRHLPRLLLQPRIADPAFGGAAAYQSAFESIVGHARQLATQLPLP